MRKVVFFDRSYVFIENDKEEAIMEQKKLGAPFWLNHSAGRDLVDPRSIARITSAGNEGPKVSSDHLIEAPKQPFNSEAPGYKKFLAMRDKLVRKKSV